MHFFDKIQEEGRLQQFSAVLLGTLCAISDGMQYAWTAPIIPILEAPNSPIKIAHSDILWLENIYMIGGFAGIPITIFNVNKFGRKVSILVGTVQNLIAWVLIAFAPSVEYLYIGRFLTGVSGNVDFVSAPMYIGEISDKKIRGFLGAWIYLKMLLGVLIVYCVAPFVSIPISSAVGCSFLVIQLVGFPFMPESPYYYLLKGKHEDAKKSLQWLRGKMNVDKELEEISTAIQIEQSEKGRFTDFLTMKNSRYALLVMCMLNFAQHFCAYSAIIMNVHSILDDATSVLSANNISIVFSIIMLGAALISSFLMDKTGRKVLLTISSVCSGVAILLLAIYFKVKHAGINVDSYHWVPLLSVMSYAITFKLGLGLIPIVMTAELFPTKVKAIGMTIADSTYIIASILSVFMYQSLKDNYGIHVPFFVFSACCFVTAIFVKLIVPETKGKTLEEIQDILSGKLNKKSNNVEINANEVSHELDMSNFINTES